MTITLTPAQTNLTREALLDDLAETLANAARQAETAHDRSDALALTDARNATARAGEIFATIDAVPVSD